MKKILFLISALIFTLTPLQALEEDTILPSESDFKPVILEPQERIEEENQIENNQLEEPIKDEVVESELGSFLNAISEIKR